MNAALHVTLVTELAGDRKGLWGKGNVAIKPPFATTCCRQTKVHLLQLSCTLCASRAAIADMVRMVQQCEHWSAVLIVGNPIQRPAPHSPCSSQPLPRYKVWSSKLLCMFKDAEYDHTLQGLPRGHGVHLQGPSRSHPHGVGTSLHPALGP